MSFENWLNLWKYKHWKLVEAQLHTWYALFSAFCVCVFLYFFCCCCCLFIFPFFSVVGFPFHPQFFFPMLHLLFLPFILLILLLICLKPHLQKSAFHPYETVRTSCMGHILNQLYFTSAWLLVTLLLCRKQWIRWLKNRSEVWFILGAVHTNPEKKNGVSKMSRFVWTWPLGPVNKDGG